MKLTSLKTLAKAKTSAVVMAAKTHAPTILTVVGVAGVVGGTVLACKATLKLDEVLDEGTKTLENIEAARANPDISDEQYSEEDAANDRRIVRVQTVVKVAKLYAPAVAVGGLGVAAMLYSNVLLRNRATQAIFAYEALDKSFKLYREKVKAELGELEESRMAFGMTDIPGDVRTVVDEDGNKHEFQAVNVNPTSIYCRVFDHHSGSYTTSPFANRKFLNAQQNYANDLLVMRETKHQHGYVLLSEVLQSLGLPIDPESTCVGWVNDPNNDKQIDFGINSIENSGFLNGYDKDCMLDFNVEGYVLDKLKK